MMFAPMLAILFIGARMRALQMDPVNGKPQTWAQNCFFMCTYALLLQTCLCIAIPLVVGGEVKKGETEGDMVYTVANPNGPQYTPPISVTMQCVINLTVQFFVVYLVIWIAITVKEFTGWEWHFITSCMENAKGTIAFCPMLAILFA